MASSTLVQIATSPNFTEGTILVDKVMEWSSEMINEVDINTIGEDNIRPGMRIYARAQYRHHVTGGSGWGPVRSFGLSSHKHLTAGITLVTGGPGIDKPFFRRVDLAGKFDNDPFDYKNHRLYTTKVFQTQDNGNDMVVFKTIYIKTAPQGIDGTDCAGFQTWWLSTHKWDDTWKPMSTFVRDNSIKSQIMIGKYLATIAGNKLVSVNSTTASVGNTLEQFRNLAIKNNVNGVSGYRLIDVHDLALLKALFLIFAGRVGWDSNSYWASLSGENLNNFLGLVEICSPRYHCLADKCNFNSPTTSAFNIFNTDESTIAFVSKHSIPLDLDSQQMIQGVPFSDGEVVVNDISRNIMEFFLPKTADVYVPNQSFQDQTKKTTLGALIVRPEHVWMSFGCQDSGFPNLFNLHGFQDAYTQTTTRIAKS